MRLLLIAIRNLGRNFRRTLITSLAVILGVAALLILQGFDAGFLDYVIDNVVQTRIGAIQVHKKGYVGAEDPLKFHFKDDPALRAKIASVAGVNAVAARIAFDGMVSNGSDSTMFLAAAIEPDNEYKVCPGRKTHVAPGAHPLDAEHKTGVILGPALASALGAQLGSSLTMQSASPMAGGTNAVDADIAGFLPAVFIAESKRMAVVQLPFAQDLLRMEGEITEYAVGVQNFDDVEPVATRLRAALGDAYEVHTWHQLSPDTDTRVKSTAWVLGIVALILFLLVATGIVNTMMMSVYERVREIGTMLAVGVRRRQITAMFLEEAIALGALGAALGVAIGAGLVGYAGSHGVHFTPPGGDPTMIRPHVTLAFVAWTALFAVVGTALAAVYPAWRASRLDPVSALRAN